MATDRSTALDLLRRALATDEATFRDGQWEAIDALVNRRERLLVVQRTGWGKSSVYFIATRILRDRGRGPTLIVSPLLALMRNQIDAADRLGIRALTINSTNRDDWPALQAAVLANDADALLISPERLANDEFVERVLLPIAGSIGLLVVDEAHCISDWGHDFRPDYRRVVNVVQRMPDNVPVLGTTATANDRVVTDVRAQLGEIGILRGSLMRDTLALQAMRLPTQAARLAWLAEHIQAMPGTGIIYTLTKRDADQVADWLTRHGAVARAYYSGVTGEGFEKLRCLPPPPRGSAAAQRDQSAGGDHGTRHGLRQAGPRIRHPLSGARIDRCLLSAGRPRRACNRLRHRHIDGGRRRRRDP